MSEAQDAEAIELKAIRDLTEKGWDSRLIMAALKISRATYFRRIRRLKAMRKRLPEAVSA